jgi:hypothetical protein
MITSPGLQTGSAFRTPTLFEIAPSRLPEIDLFFDPIGTNRGSFPRQDRLSQWNLEEDSESDGSEG